MKPSILILLCLVMGGCCSKDIRIIRQDVRDIKHKQHQIRMDVLLMKEYVEECYNDDCITRVNIETRIKEYEQINKELKKGIKLIEDLMQ